MYNEIQNKAYLLWEKDRQENKPERDPASYWAEAELRCLSRSYNVRSGELDVEGEGPLDDVVDGALHHAHNNNIYLSESMTLLDCEGRSYVIDTLSNLVRLGLTQ